MTNPDPTPRDLRDERWLAERLEQSAREARRPLWAEERAS